MFTINTTAFEDSCEKLKKVFYQMNSAFCELDMIQKRISAMSGMEEISLQLMKASRGLEERVVSLGSLIQGAESIVEEYIRTEERVVEVCELGVMQRKNYQVGNMDLSRILNNLTDIKLV